MHVYLFSVCMFSTDCIRTEFTAGTIYFRTVGGVEKLEALLFQLECKAPIGAAMQGNAAADVVNYESIS